MGRAPSHHQVSTQPRLVGKQCGHLPDISVSCVRGTRGRVTGAGEPKANGTYRQHLFQSTNAANPTYDKSFDGVGKNVRPNGVGPDLWRHSGPGSTARHGPYVLQDASFGGWFIGSLEPNTWDLYTATAIAGPWQTCLSDPTRSDASKSANAGLEPSPQVALAPAASSSAPAHATAVAATRPAAPAPAPAAAVAAVTPSQQLTRPEAMDLNSDEDEDGVEVESEIEVEVEAGEASEAGEVAPCELWEKGSKVDALDVAGMWYAAKVVDERSHGDARELLVHYTGWKARYDEWVGVGSGRVRAAGSGELGPCKRLAAAATAANLKTGSRVDALDPHGTWYPAAVLDERGAGLSRELLVHYNGWNKRLDEWMGVCSGRLRAASGKLGPSKPTVASAPGAAAGSDGATPAAARVPKMQAEDGGGNKPRKTNIAEDDLVWAKVWGTRDGWCGRTLSPNMGVRTALTSPCCLQVACAGDRNQQG